LQNKQATEFCRARGFTLARRKRIGGKGAEGDPNVTTLIEIRGRNIIKHEGSFRDDVSTMGKIRPSWLSLARQ